jgi:hypothetical protein
MVLYSIATSKSSNTIDDTILRSSYTTANTNLANVYHITEFPRILQSIITEQQALDSRFLTISSSYTIDLLQAEADRSWQTCAY